MTEAPDTAALERLVGSLEDTAGRLRSGQLTPEQAAALVEQCALGAAQAAAELERLARVAASEQDSDPPQGRLV